MTAKSRSALTTEVASVITGQTTANSITPTTEGGVFQDIVDSAFNPLTDISNPGTPANGQLLIGNATNYTLATLTQGANITITNTSGAITIAATGGGSSPLTTKGDLYGFDTAANRIPVGGNNQVLTADSTQALGVKWATPTTGAGTVNSGTAGQFAQYGTTGTAVSGSSLFVYDATVASPINGLIVTPGATGTGVSLFPVGTGADTQIPITLRNIGTSTFSLILGNTSNGNAASLGYNSSSTQRVTFSSTGATFASGWAVTVAGTLAVTGVTTHSSGVSFPTRAVTTATTTTASDYAVFANGTFTVTLHTPTAGQVLNLKNTGAGVITISGTTDLGSSTVAAGVNVSLIYDIAGATWRAQ